jgi:twitching motility protein PilT
VLTEVLVRVNDVSSHGDLCELLASSDPELRSAAAEVLRHVGGKTALEVLVKRSLDPAFPGRMDAMNALVARAGTHALPLLRAVVSAGRPLEKIHALRHLASRERFGRDVQSAVDAAATALDDKDDLVVAQAIATLGDLGVEGLWDALEPRVEGRGADVLRALLTQGAREADERVASYFRRRMREGPKAVRLLVLEVIEAAGSELLFPTLVDALSNRDVAVRTRSVHTISALAESGRIDAARAIVWLLRSTDVGIRRTAAEIANRVGDRDGTLAPKLLKYLRDTDWWVRDRMLDALVRIAGANLTRQIIKDYLGDPSDLVRRFAVNALMRINDPRALGALVRTAQEDKDWLVAEVAVEAIGKLGDQRAEAYLTELLTKRAELRVACVRALRDIEAKSALPTVADLLQDGDADVKIAVIEMMDKLDDGTHALWVKACEADTSPSVREAAGRLLRRYKMERAPAEGARENPKTLDALLHHVVAEDADDLFLQAGRPPYVKSRGQVKPLGNRPLGGDAIVDLVAPHLTQDQREAFESGQEVDFSYKLASRDTRFRVNLFRQLTGPAGVFRIVSDKLPDLVELGIPEIVRSFASLPSGLVLVGGPTGAGKSTTLAALIDHINRTSARHIVTIEDPIEVVHRRRRSLINQREVGAHTRSFAEALRSTLRQDPDVILVGELRDLETIHFALTAAETGHLVFGTVHTASADTTIDRLINAFPARQQPQIRAMLAESLRAVTCQYLLRAPKAGRVPAVEVMIANDAIQTLIRKGKAFQIPSVIATSRQHGMQLMDAELIRLAQAGKAEVNDAYAKALDKRAFEAALGLPPPETSLASLPPSSGGKPSAAAPPPAASARPVSNARR